MKLAAGKQQETHFFSHQEKEKWIEHYVQWETAVPRKRVEDAERAITQEQDDMRNAEKVRLTTNKLETTCEEMLNAIVDSLSNLASSEDGDDGEDEDDDEEDFAGGKLREDDKLRRMMGTIPKTEEYRMERCWSRQVKFEELTEQYWEDAADHFCERDKKYEMTEWKVPAVVQPQAADDAKSSVLTTSSEHLETHDCIPGELPMPQVTSQPGTSQRRLGSRKLKRHKHIPSLLPGPLPDLPNT